MKKVLVFSVLGLALAVGSAAGMTASTKTVIDNCGHKAVRPAKLTIACADGNYYLASLKWTHWGKRRAVASGLAWVNLCKPNCAKGKFKSYPIHAKAYRRLRCKGHRAYRRLAVEFLHATPSGFRNPDINKMGCV